ncbi:class I SAM-dependent methyltransferase [Histidinibacterium aquaticum]|uniref:Methyltransferase domain-containing protein n=1 Tax=Histidinibacterium aquaticum TaxID=2613962 RepID=A0A5J5GLQ4_9RHOB|nr:class I SAM-dependent methyltransferase [Histidinibacterium aquaticum]KAA9008967.1 methyltransferase domain-containing protein [Histidinibacterium aquaticum]
MPRDSVAMTPEDIIELYRRVGPEWARTRSRRLFEKGWLDRFRAHLPTSGTHHSVLDLGCGSGRPLAAYLAERGAHVTGVDTAPELLEQFREHVPGGRTVEADMRGLDLRERFDGILAWDSVFHLDPDTQRAMFLVFATHAAPRAALMFTSGHRAGEAWGEVAGEKVYHASLDPGEYRTLLDGAGFDTLAYVPEDPDCGGHTVWLARRRG